MSNETSESLSVWAHSALLGIALWFGSGNLALGQLTNPIADPLPSGLSVVLEPWITIPTSPEDTTSPKMRINHLKPCPGSDRLFCNNLNGRLWVIPGSAASAPSEFLNLASFYPNFIRVSGLGTGFTSFAFHPEFATSAAPGYGKFYTAHSENASGGDVDFSGPLSAATSQVGTIVEWTMNDPADSAVTTGNHTRRTLLRIGFPYNYHDTQEIAFNPTAVPGDEDYGCLFICVGDGGSLVVSPAVPGNLGRIDSPLGSIHRIVPVVASATATGFTDSDFTVSTNGRYHIPSGPNNSNPFANFTDPTPEDGYPLVREIYANGFRNPHRISWDSGGTHKMFCGNIGEVQCEEVELVKKGNNYGWPAREGSYRFVTSDTTHVYPLQPSPDTDPTYTYPVAQYDHATGSAIVGGTVYRGAAIPELVGKYICGDVVKGKLWIASEADMNLMSSTATGSAPALLSELDIKLGNTPTSLLAILGTSRADLRFGTDDTGEIYVLSKQNGTIFKVIRDTDITTPPPQGGIADWGIGKDFEDGTLDGVTVSHTGSASQITNDPLEGASNRVLRFQNPGTSTSFYSSFPVTEIPDGSVGTLFFRFYIPDQTHDISFGLSDLANPTGFGDFEVQFISVNGNGVLQVRNGANAQTGASITTGTWYSAWCQIGNATGSTADRWNLFIKGGNYGAPTLVKTNVAFRTGTTASLKRFFIRSNTAGGTNISPIYFDDIRVDAGHVNVTDPSTKDWRLVDHFEGPNPLTDWDLPNAAQQTATIVTDTDGNHYFRRQASSGSGDNISALAARKLPFLTQVSQTFTTFFRFRLEGGNLNQQFGSSSLNPADPATYTNGDMETHLRVAAAGFDLYDGSGGAEGFIPAATDGNPIPPLANNTWYKVWMIADNAGWASGGQTWRAYIKGGIHTELTPISDTLFFHKGAEGSISHFLAIASTGAGQSFGNDAIELDDIYAFPGKNLTDPTEKSYVPTTIQHSGNQIALTHSTRLNRAYQVFESEDLQSWSPLTQATEGDGNFWATDVPMIHPRRFFLTAEHSRRNFHPATWSTDFTDGAVPAGMTLTRPSTSVWTPGVGKLTLTLTTEQAYPVVAGMVPRPGSYALAPGDWRNVDIRLNAKTLRTTATTIRDVIIPFGYVDQTHFYYAHFSATSDGTAHTVIMKVTGDKSRQLIQTPATVSPAPFVSLAPTDFRVTHNVSGAIAIYCNNMVTPFMTASDTSYPVGRVGFGSFDDPAEFYSFSASGEQH